MNPSYWPDETFRPVVVVADAANSTGNTATDRNTTANTTVANVTVAANATTTDDEVDDLLSGDDGGEDTGDLGNTTNTTDILDEGGDGVRRRSWLQMIGNKYR